jgi:hypothetical protein
MTDVSVENTLSTFTMEEQTCQAASTVFQYSHIAILVSPEDEWVNSCETSVNFFNITQVILFTFPAARI